MWQIKEDECCSEDYEQWQRDWFVVREAQRSGHPDDYLRCIRFEDECVGSCCVCGRALPATKKWCPTCRPSKY